MRRNWLKVLFVLVLFALPGADIECEDDEFELDWPDIDVHHGGFWYAEPVYVEPVCCWYW
jgi:hypothetical protein